MGLFGPSFSKVWNEGTPAPGTLIGIMHRVVSDDDSSYEIEEYAVDLGGEIVGVRQKLTQLDEVRLGMPVTVHRDGKAVVIRRGTPNDTRWKTVTPPGAGIDDRSSGGPGNGWTRGRAEILEIGARSAMLGLTTVEQAKVRFTGTGPAAVEPIEALVDKYYPPFYASHLGAVGTTVLAAQHPRDARKIAIDWPASAVAEPGVGVAPLPDRTATASASGLQMGVGGGIGHTQPGFGRKGFLDRLQDKAMAASAAAMGAATEATPPTDDPVPWETFLAVSVAIKNEPGTKPDEIAQRHGIPAGEWAAVNTRWMARIMTDWQLGAAFGQALS
jgi:hypothetical protein